MDDEKRRRELKEFLRSKRASLKPEAAGISTKGYRRTPGLRREEVAAAAGVGITWYTWLEQGRDVSPSRAALRNIARALHLSPTDEQLLLLLGGFEPVVSQPATHYTVDARMQTILDGFQMLPALLFGRFVDVLAYNRIADAVFDLSSGRDRFGTNHVWRLFMDEERRALYVDWETIAARTVGVVRVLRARHPDDPYLERLLDALFVESPDFARLWRNQATAPLDAIRLRLRHPRLGRLETGLVRFVLATDPDVVLSVLSPENRETAGVFARVASATTRGGPSQRAVGVKEVRRSVGNAARTSRSSRRASARVRKS